LSEGDKIAVGPISLSLPEPAYPQPPTTTPPVDLAADDLFRHGFLE
jgi:hypothetical protein